MGIELTQKLVAGTLIIGGLGGGYFALTGGTSATLLGMHKALGREENDNWESVATKYKEEAQTDTIDGIKKQSNKLSKDIEKWCNSKKNTYYLGDTDKTYQSYSIWCLKEETIQNVLEKQKLKWLSDKWDKKLEKYKQNFDKFIKDESKPVIAGQQPQSIPDEKLNAGHISSWCEKNRIKRYKYKGEDDERKVRLFCYWTDAQIEEANKPKQVAPSGQETDSAG